MDHFEMVEKLRKKTQVSYEEAKAALEANDWDLLDALIYLESRGKTSAKGEADYTTRRVPKKETKSAKDISSAGGRIWGAFADIVHAGNSTMFQIYYRKKFLIELPITVMILLIIMAFPTIIFAFIIAMFFGIRYKIYTEEGKSADINRWLDKAADKMSNNKHGKDWEE